MAKSSQASSQKLGVQQVLLYAVMVIAFFVLFQFKLLPVGVSGFITYLFQPTGEEKQKIELVQYKGLCWASSSKDKAAEIYKKGLTAPNKDDINKDFIFDFTFEPRTMDQHGYVKSSTEWIAKSTTLGENQIVLEPWIGFWILALVISIVLATVISMFLPTSLGFMAVLFDRQIENTKAKIRLQTGFSDDIVDLLTMPDDKLEAAEFNVAEVAFRTVWNRTEGEATSTGKNALEFEDVFNEDVDLVSFRKIHLYSRIKEFFSEFVLKEIEDTKNGLLWRRNHTLVMKGLRLYMSHHFTEKYSNNVTGLAYGGAAVLIVTVGIRGLKFIPAAKPSIILFATFLEFTMLALMAFTLMYTEEEERMDKMLKKMEDGSRSSLEALRAQQHDIHQLANVLIGQSAEIIKTRVESAITEYMTSDDNIKKVVAEEISEKILYGMREAFSGPIPNKK